MNDKRPEVNDLEEELAWSVYSGLFAVGAISIVSSAAERGDVDLGMPLSAWDNIMAAAEWAMMARLHGRIQGPVPVTVEDVERMRRLHSMGSTALAGGDRSSEMPSLAMHCMESLLGPDWNSVVGEAVCSVRELVQEPPPS